MKRLFFIALCITGLLGCTQKQKQKHPEVVERPVFDVSYSSMLEIDKIERRDIATIVHLTAYMRPEGRLTIDPNTYLRKSGKKDKWKVIKSEGIDIGKPTIITESGLLSFKLFFQPLKPEITKIDFIEDIPDDGWSILGIRLLPAEKIVFDNIPADLSRTSSEALPAATYSTKPAKVSGKLLGYSADLGIKTILVNTYNILTGDKIEVEFPLSRDGSFRGELAPGIGGFVRTSEGLLFLVPGKESKMYVDLKKRSRFESHYRADKEPGDSAYNYLSESYFTYAEQNEITQQTIELFDLQLLKEETANMNPEEFKKHVLGIMHKKIDELKQQAYRPNMLMMIENYLKMVVCDFLLDVKYINATYIRINPDITYYSFLKDLMNDNMSYHPRYSSLITTISQIDFFTNGDLKTPKERFAFFKEKAAPALGTKGMVLDVIQAQFYAQQLNDMRLYTDAEKKEIKDAFSGNPAYAATLIEKNDLLAKLFATNKGNKECVMNETPDVSQEKIFDAIIAKYKGKVVFVDFWATWCSPCIAAMKTIKPVKDEMKSKDVVFLYLTGEISPFGAWIHTFPTITGEHYRVNEDQWRYLCNTFSIRGIPFYMVFDKHGRLLSTYEGFPGVNAVKKDIEKCL